VPFKPATLERIRTKDRAAVGAQNHFA